MLNFFRLAFSIFVILIITPQTPTENILLRKFYETGFFESYFETKFFIDILTWFCIFFFITTFRIT